MIDLNTLNTLISINYQTLVIIFFCLTGATVKDIYNSLKGIDGKVKLTRIFVSTITSSILMYSFTDILAVHLGLSSKVLISVYFFCGLSGFNALEKLSTIEGIMDFLKYIKDYFNKEG